MSKSKLFIENILVYGVGGIISKIIPVIMIPIITKLMPNSEYVGISDMTSTLVSVACVFAVLGMYDGLFRLYFEKDDKEYKIKTCSTAFTFTVVMSCIVFLVMVILRNPISKLIFHNTKYSFLVLISAITVLFSGTNQIVAAPTRMQNKRAIYLTVNSITPLISYLLAVCLLIGGYYVTALPIAALITGLAIECYYFFINRKWFDIRKYDWKILKQMLIISLPLVPNFITYWIFNSCDRLMITSMLDLSAEGVYSIGAKLGHCSQLIYTAFAGGWSFFVFSTMKDKDQIRYNSRLFEALAIVSYLATAFICVFSYTIYDVLFSEEYTSGFIVAPYLFICPLLLMLFQVSSSQFTVVKKTWYSMITLLFGAGINVLLNWILIPIMGNEGAAVATLCGYSISLIICLMLLTKFKLFIVSKRFLLMTVVTLAFGIIWRFYLVDKLLISVISMISFDLIVCFIYHKEVKSFTGRIWRKIRG